jgi:hypothetical protein
LVVGRLTVPNIESRCNQLKLGHPRHQEQNQATPNRHTALHHLHETPRTKSKARRFFRMSL